MASAVVAQYTPGLRDWWERADPVFSHIEYKSYLRRSYQHWKREWLDYMCGQARCTDLRVAEFGIGAGLLGARLLSDYNIRHYDGLEISPRQRDAAALRLNMTAHVAGTSFALHDSMVTTISSLHPDAFISQAVVQHFPSQQYLDRWLADVDQSGAATLMLQVRTPIGKACRWCVCSDDVCQPQPSTSALLAFNASQSQMQWALMVNTSHLQRRLTRYKLEWASQPSKDTYYVSHIFCLRDSDRCTVRASRGSRGGHSTDGARPLSSRVV